MHRNLGEQLYNTIYNAVYDPRVDSTDEVRRLLAKGAEVNWRHPEYGSTPLYRAARNGDAKVVQLLLKHGALVDMANSSGRTPLMTAAFHGHVEVLNILLANGADQHLRPYRGSWVSSRAEICTAEQAVVDCMHASVHVYSCGGRGAGCDLLPYCWYCGGGMGDACVT